MIREQKGVGSAMKQGAGRGASIGVPDGWMDGTADQRAHDLLPPMLPAAWPRGTSSPRPSTPLGDRRSGDAGRRPVRGFRRGPIEYAQKLKSPVPLQHSPDKPQVCRGILLGYRPGPTPVPHRCHHVGAGRCPSLAGIVIGDGRSPARPITDDEPRPRGPVVPAKWGSRRAGGNTPWHAWCPTARRRLTSSRAWGQPDRADRGESTLLA
jgi:hypothetical protein